MTGRAWPFLVARGRRRGYSALLVPGFLREHGFLEATAIPLDDVPSRAVATPHGVLVWAEHAVTAAEARGEPRDEYGRPLVLLHGFLCPDGEPVTASAALAWTTTAALTTYGRFLADEEGFRTDRSEPFPIEVAAVARPRVAPPEEPARPVRGLVGAGAAALVVAGAVAAVVGFASAGDDAPVLSPCARDVVELTGTPTVPAATCVRDGKPVPYSLPPSRRP
ncbi:hypothetical protein DMA12_06410 [Amycolatopsis balhimycina DSM 5908]|uniref:Uncharacterized protein n=1 Tax=Amycolatopsis balhimycina DSM 5908 TaxID=1081091 RepID=A0A428X0B1_AMYBA|nr:hypothetical protein [Amycolatopsis balhimycina]RSM48746.1 hypothetical protein DMA12_06410 [Amycolatopsis balhimycina DSM 5908]